MFVCEDRKTTRLLPQVEDEPPDIFVAVSREQRLPSGSLASNLVDILELVELFHDVVLRVRPSNQSLLQFYRRIRILGTSGISI